MSDMNSLLETTFGKFVAALLVFALGGGSSVAILEYKFNDLKEEINKVHEDTKAYKQDTQDNRLRIEGVNGQLKNIDTHLQYQRKDLEEIKNILMKSK